MHAAPHNISGIALIADLEYESLIQISWKFSLKLSKYLIKGRLSTLL